jgi:hypothetical protein
MDLPSLTIAVRQLTSLGETEDGRCAWCGQAGGWLGRESDESIGVLLARVRLAQGKSQLRVAELLCAASGMTTVTRHEVSRWEREERIPSYWLPWLSLVLRVPLDVLEVAVTRSRRPGRLRAVDRWND